MKKIISFIIISFSFFFGGLFFFQNYYFFKLIQQASDLQIDPSLTIIPVLSKTTTIFNSTVSKDSSFSHSNCIIIDSTKIPSMCFSKECIKNVTLKDCKVFVENNKVFFDNITIFDNFNIKIKPSCKMILLTNQLKVEENFLGTCKIEIYNTEDNMDIHKDITSHFFSKISFVFREGDYLVFTKLSNNDYYIETTGKNSHILLNNLFKESNKKIKSIINKIQFFFSENNILYICKENDNYIFNVNYIKKSLSDNMIKEMPYIKDIENYNIEKSFISFVTNGKKYIYKVCFMLKNIKNNKDISLDMVFDRKKVFFSYRGPEINLNNGLDTVSLEKFVNISDIEGYMDLVKKKVNDDSSFSIEKNDVICEKIHLITDFLLKIVLEKSPDKECKVVYQDKNFYCEGNGEVSIENKSFNCKATKTQGIFTNIHFNIPLKYNSGKWIKYDGDILINVKLNNNSVKNIEINLKNFSFADKNFKKEKDSEGVIKIERDTNKWYINGDINIININKKIEKPLLLKFSLNIIKENQQDFTCLKNGLISLNNKEYFIKSLDNIDNSFYIYSESGDVIIIDMIKIFNLIIENIYPHKDINVNINFIKGFFNEKPVFNLKTSFLIYGVNKEIKNTTWDDKERIEDTDTYNNSV
jgi:hypothetical protein